MELAVKAGAFSPSGLITSEDGSSHLDLQLSCLLACSLALSPRFLPKVSNWKALALQSFPLLQLYLKKKKKSLPINEPARIERVQVSLLSTGTLP